MTEINTTAPEAGHTDIVRAHWIEHKLPRTFRPFAYLMRLDRPIGTWLLLLPGWWAIMAGGQGIENLGWYGVYMILLFGVGAVIMRGAGCIINDLWDVEYDKLVERTKNRPLASGAISKTQAMFFLMLLLWVGLIILVQLPSAAIFIGLAVMLLVVSYPLAKRVTWYPQFVLGLTFNIGALMGWASIAGAVEAPAWALYGAGIAWTLGYDTIYAHQDKNDDAIVGVRSTALKFGDHSPLWIFWFYMLAAILLYASGMMMDVSWPFYVIWAFGAFHLIAQIVSWDMDDAASCLRTFRSNRSFGLIVFAAFALGFLPAPYLDFSFLKF
jgi:4-hydroxybenzoate polyprenyltransferase